MESSRRFDHHTQLSSLPPKPLIVGDFCEWIQMLVSLCAQHKLTKLHTHEPA